MEKIRWKHVRSYRGFEYIDVRYKQTFDEKHGWIVDAKTLKDMEEGLAKQILISRVPLRGMEIQFIRKAVGLTLQSFGGLLRLSPTAVMRWEQKMQIRLDYANEIAVRITLAKHLGLHVTMDNVILPENIKPDAIHVDGAA